MNKILVGNKADMDDRRVKNLIFLYKFLIRLQDNFLNAFLLTLSSKMTQILRFRFLINSFFKDLVNDLL